MRTDTSEITLSKLWSDEVTVLCRVRRDTSEVTLSKLWSDEVTVPCRVKEKEVSWLIR